MMRLPHLFEFMDQSWVKGGLRTTLREILECGNGPPFRAYYPWVAGEVLRQAKEAGLTNLVELGAGTAPITRTLARGDLASGIRLLACDVNPDRPTLEQLASQHPNRVEPVYESVDFSRPCTWPDGTLPYLSATFHHIPGDERAAVLQHLVASANCVMIFEPLRRTWSSALFVFLSIVPALLVPLWYLSRPGRARRFLWCWLVPVAPVMFWWDGVVSCVRQLTAQEWRVLLRSLDDTNDFNIHETVFCQAVTITGAKSSAS